MNTGSHSIQQALARASGELAHAGIETPRLDAEVLLAYCLKTDRAALYRDALGALEHDSVEQYRRCIDRRVQREPVAYITGVKEFRSMDFRVTRDVLIPRPETETLVEELISEATRLVSVHGALRVLEVGTGSGIIAVTVAKEVNRLQAVAVDCSHAIVTLARSNAQLHGVDHKILFYAGDLCGALKVRHDAQLFHAVLANPPYLSDEEWLRAAPEIRNYEPERALRAGGDGLACYRELIPAAVGLLRSGGYIMLEIGHGQAGDVTGLIDRTGLFAPVVTINDLGGMPRLVKAHKR